MFPTQKPIEVYFVCYELKNLKKIIFRGAKRWETESYICSALTREDIVEHISDLM